MRRLAVVAGLLVVALAAFAGTPVRSRADAGPGSVAQAGGALKIGSPSRATLHQVRTATPHSARAAAPRTSPAAGRIAPLRHPYASPQVQAARAAAAATGRAPLATSSAVESSASSAPALGSGERVFQSFDGANSVDNYNVNGFEIEPPDQGLCASRQFVVELLNDVGAIYGSNGTIVGTPFDLNSFFGEDPNTEALTDPRCTYDPSTGAWFATTLALEGDPNTGNYTSSHVDIAVNTNADPASPWTVYSFDTTDLPSGSYPGGANCPCFGDQPLLAVDSAAVYISSNEFPLGLENTFNGTQLYMISKTQLLRGAQSPNLIHYSGFSYNGFTLGSIQPAQNSGLSPAEYFLASFDPFGTTDTTLFAFAMTNERAIDSATDFPALSGVSFSGQLYGLPPNAQQAGGTGFELNSDDDRMQQVQNLNGTLLSSLDTVVQIAGDSTNRSGAAWYQIVPRLGRNNLGQLAITGATIAQQGILAVSGNYLLYPAIAAAGNRRSAPVMVMTLSGPQTYPSAIWSAAPFSSYVVTATGAGPDQGFTCSPPFSYGVCRWGDYSAAVLVPGRNRIWLATEYISPATITDPYGNTTNWATHLTEVGAR